MKEMALSDDGMVLYRFGESLSPDTTCTCFLALSAVNSRILFHAGCSC